jgi:hypothetical protein
MEKMVVVQNAIIITLLKEKIEHIVKIKIIWKIIIPKMEEKVIILAKMNY